MTDQYDDFIAPESPASGEPASSPPAFGPTLRRALERRGLSLQRLRDHLAARGIRVSVVTLSHWQRGRSQPERADSLRAVAEMEAILHLPAGALQGLLGPRRPRGRSLPTPPERTQTARPVYGPKHQLVQALGEEAFNRLNAGTVPLSIHDTLSLDSTGRAHCTVTQVVRATHDGADHVIAYLELDESSAPSMTASVQCGTLIDQRYTPELGLLTMHIGFGRPLTRGESAVITYDIEIGPQQGEDTRYERVLPCHLRQYFLHIRFHPQALPASLFGYYRARYGAPRQDIRPLSLSASGTAHIMPTDAAAGVHGISWT
ncbi:helix-turn-helix transcriptional regulator [Streptomyces sp. NPDC047017]|uniref:helix-turn-helix domain-containing protein n=1 Tax=Streptomyces sp. NPDC047017 TaxID=3155024 RepID=UPI0033FF89D3